MFKHSRVDISFSTEIHLRIDIRIMNVEELSRSALNGLNPPPGLKLEAQILWYARAGKWEIAHDLCADALGKGVPWIHAWLHRQEGDLANAAYWYSQAGRAMPAVKFSLEDEWMHIATVLLGK